VDEIFDIVRLEDSDRGCGDPPFRIVDGALERTQPVFVLEHTVDMDPQLTAQ
jgi:hypothetical protein